MPEPRARPVLGAFLVLVLSGTVACSRGEDRSGKKGVSSAAARAEASADERPEVTRALEALRREETELRARTDFAALPPSSRSLGSNPYAIVALALGANAPPFAGVLRGDSALVLLDANASEVSRLGTVLSPNALAALPDGRLFVVGDVEPRVARYRLAGERLVADGDISIPEASSLRAVVADSRALFVADFSGDKLFSKSLVSNGPETPMAAQPLCGGPFRLELTEHFVGALCLFGHAIVLFERDSKGLVSREVGRITHDGPLWGFSLGERDQELLVAAGGIEDHPLDRRDKAFGYVDSFAYLYRLDPARRLTRLYAVNTSELGVVTPKLTKVTPHASGVRVTVAGYASDVLLELELVQDDPTRPKVRADRTGLPGCSAAVFSGETLVCANPLLDAWVTLSARDAPKIQRVRAPTPSDPTADERLGEALFFTTLMAPDATSAGRRSRFTCETCHFEGGTDGRVHHSGRDDIRVSTRPLLGLFNDAPHFSRAHDRDLTSVSHNEFSVANRGNPIDPWFTLAKARFPWLGELGVSRESVAPFELRRALLVFLARFSHAENPLAVRRPLPRRFTSEERRGAEIFRERCASCHAARLVAQDPTKEAPFERWEELVLSPAGPIVWSNGEYAKTGVTPYVDPKGTRTPSLRRLYLKRPYLTNGSAKTLDALAAAARFSSSTFSHAPSDGEAQRRGFTSDERQALLRFLEIL